MPNIQVSLDTKANPPVTVDTPDLEISRGEDTIRFVRASDQNFEFSDLTFVPPPPPGTLTVGPISPDMITVTDKNNTAANFSYVITVKSGSTYYSSAGRTAAVNAAISPDIMRVDGGTPTIHNR